MNKLFEDLGFEHYIYWRKHDLKTFDKINRLLKSIERDGFLRGEGKPERLKYGAGYSRRIDDANHSARRQKYRTSSRKKPSSYICGNSFSDNADKSTVAPNAMRI